MSGLWADGESDRQVSPLRAGRFVGRVGALAVALGIGVAVTAFPGVAVADPSADQESSSASKDDGENEDSGADVDDTAADTEDEDDPDTEDDPEEEPEPEPAEEPEPDEGDEEPTGDDAEVISPPVGDDLDVDDENSDRPDQVVPVQPVVEESVHEEPSESSAFAVESDEPEPTARTSARVAVVAEPVEAPVETVAALSLPESNTVVPVALSAPTAALTTPLSIVTSVLNAVLAPFVSQSDPLAPTQQVTLLAVLAWVRRQVEHTFFNKTPTVVADQATELIDADTIEGSVTGADADDDPLEYSYAGGDPGATIVVNPDGTWSYTAPVSWTGEQDWEDEFTVTVSDADAGFHLHGLFGLFKPNFGHTDTVTVKVTLPADTAEAPVIHDVYSFDSGDPDTGTQVVRVVVQDAVGADTLTVTPTAQTGTVGEATYLGTNTGGDHVYEFTYTPTPQQRVAAYLTEGDDTETIAITLSDGTLSDSEDFDVPISPAQAAAVATTADSVAGTVVFAPDGTGYLTTYDETAQTTKVIVIDANGTRDIDLAGRAAGNVSFGPDGSVYQTTTSSGAQTTTTVSAIDGPLAGQSATMFGAANYGAVIASDGTIYQTTTSGSGLAQQTYLNALVDFEGGYVSVQGEPSGPLVLGPNGEVYQTAYVVTPNTSNVVTRVLVHGGPTPGVIGPYTGGPEGTVQIGSDGVARQTVHDWNTSTTRVVTLNGTNAGSVTQISGTAGNPSPIAAAPDGTPYIVTTMAGNATSRVTNLGDGSFVVVPGQNTGPVVFGPDGTMYVATYTGDFVEGFTSTLSAVDNGVVTTIAEAPGIAADGAVIGDDGTVYLVSHVLPLQGQGQTFITAADAPVGTDPIELPGIVASPRVQVFDGVMYVTTRPWSGGESFWVTSISDGQAETIEIPGNASDGVRVAPDGSVYQVAWADGETSVWLVGLPTPAVVEV